MNNHEFRWQLNQTVPDISPAFRAALQQTLSDIAAGEHEKHNAAHQKHLRRFGGFTRKALLAVVIALLLIGTAALASALLHQNVFEIILGNSPENAASIMQYDLAKESFNECDVEVRQAAYDGVSLYVVYSIRERSATELLGMIDTEPDIYYVSSETFPAMERDEVGWWWDCLWIDGEWVQLPDYSSGMVLGSGTPGELLFYNLYRLDQANIFPYGKAVEIALPIGRRPALDTLDFNEESGMLAKPDTGLITFTLDCSIRSGVTVTHPGTVVSLPFVTAQITEVTYSPIQMYLTMSLQLSPDDTAAPDTENGGNEGFGHWISCLQLVDGDGQPVYDDVMCIGKYGLLGYSETQACFTFPYLKTYPDAMYLTPMDDGIADMTQAVRVR